MSELAEQEVPVVAALQLVGKQSLLHSGGFRFAIYPRCGGRSPRSALAWPGFYSAIVAFAALSMMSFGVA